MHVVNMHVSSRLGRFVCNMDEAELLIKTLTDDNSVWNKILFEIAFCATLIDLLITTLLYY